MGTSQLNLAHFERVTTGVLDTDDFWIEQRELNFRPSIVESVAERMGECFEQYTKLRRWVLNIRLKTKEVLQIRLREDVFVPTKNAQLLLQVVEAESQGKRVLDIGAGTGIFALASLKSGATETVGVEVCPPALRLARQNARANGLVNAKFISPDDLESEGQFGLIVVNLPQTPTESFCGPNGNALVLEYLEKLLVHMESDAVVLLPVVSYADPKSTVAQCQKQFQEVEVVGEQYISLPDYFDETTLLRVFSGDTGEFFTETGVRIKDTDELIELFRMRKLYSRNTIVRLAQPSESQGELYDAISPANAEAEKPLCDSRCLVNC